jgi:hypothetical protein
VRTSLVRLEVQSEYIFSAGGVLNQPLESVELPWGIRTKDPIRESCIPGRNAGNTGELVPLKSCSQLYVITQQISWANNVRNNT